MANPAFSTAEKTGTHPECQPIEELLGQEHLHEIEAADDVDVLVPVMQFMYSFTDIWSEQSGVVPFEDRCLAGGHVLRNTVERLRGVPVLPSPVRGGGVVGPTPM
ncbi:hypothetical protein BLJ79_18200 [Arthrobacter sp. UCD-GKA]|nr:hypothetical protein BLJ79_18200 [Arthrobacter sp. UCD-GKA]